MSQSAIRPQSDRSSDESLQALYERFAENDMVPLWTQVDELMPEQPTPAAVPHIWRWSNLYPLAQRAGDLVPVGRGGERRAIALANPGLGGQPFVTSTLWAAVQYLGPHEVAPEHRHTQNAFRFVLEGEGVWTVVDGDPVAMRRGDFLLTPGWHFHGHQNASSSPMAWLDGLDIPYARHMDSTFFEYGQDELTSLATPARSRSERLWGYPGLRPTAIDARPTSSPLVAYRWSETDRALADQLALEDEGYTSTLEPGHASITFCNPSTGGDVLRTIRAEFHRLREGTQTSPKRELCSSVWQVFSGAASITMGSETSLLEHGDTFCVPPWVEWQLATNGGVDLFRFSDAPIYEALGQYKSRVRGPAS